MSPRVLRSQRTFAPARSRRAVSWTVGPRGTMTVSTDSDNLFTSAVQLVVDDATLVRTRGELLLGLTSVTSALDGFNRIAFGICKVTENAAGVGVTAVPSPITDEAWDGWLAYWTGSLFSKTATETNLGDTLAAARIVIDSKAMRKSHNSDFFVAALATAGEVGSATMVAKLNSRFLFKLH